MKRILALALIAVFAASFCACAKGEQNVSSNITNNEASSVIQSEENETSSKKETSSAQTSSVETESEQSSSKKTALRGEHVEDVSSTVSIAIKNPGINPAKTRLIGCYHLNPGWTTSLGSDEESIYEEFEAIFENGYFNTIIVSAKHLVSQRFWDTCKKYNLTVWIDMWSYYKSSDESIEEYIEDYDMYIQTIIKDSEKWDRVLGFHLEEYVWRGQKVEDYLTQTKALYQKYGKRIFAVYATGEFSGQEGNAGITGDTADKSDKMTTKSLQYTTDISFDSYAVDVRDGVSHADRIPAWQKKISKNIVDGKSYYTEYIRILKELTGHPANVWFFPTAYACWIGSGLNGITFADEGYCIGHLKFFDELLSKQEHQGGIFLYTYTKFGKDGTNSLQQYLDLKDKKGNQMIYLDYDKWYDYSKLIRDITTKYRASEVDILTSL